MMREYKLIIPGKAVGKQRPRMFNPKYRDGRPIMKRGQPVMIPHTPMETRNFEATVKQVAWDAKIPMLERCAFEVIVCIPCRRVTYKTKPDMLLEPGIRPDADNVFKACADALQGIAFKNDKNILDARSSYRFLLPGKQMHTEIIIREVKWEDYKESEC